jgi:Glycosyltransferase
MKILHINKYFYLKGGPENYLFRLAELFEEKGHNVAFFSMQHDQNVPSKWNQYFVKNIDYNNKYSLWGKIKVFSNTLYSFEARDKLLKLIDNFKPDIAHLHNYHHQLTPSIIHALDKRRIPVVAKLPDYKMICPSYSMLNHGKICELCRDRKYYNCVLTKCHKNSFSKSLLATVESYLHHRYLKSYKNIKCYICPSNFLLNKFKQMGFKGNLMQLSNYVDTNEYEPNYNINTNKIIYWGRLSVDKGVKTLIEAMKGSNLQLVVVGEGPIKEDLENMVRTMQMKNIHFKGYLKGKELQSVIKDSLFAVLPSEWYENNPNSVLEAFALGKPVIGSRIGGIPELVKDGETGYTFEPGNAGDLSDKMMMLLSDDTTRNAMGQNARKLVEAKFNPEKHYQELMEIYQSVIEMN